jgi:hypothetical protein
MMPGLIKGVGHVCQKLSHDDARPINMSSTFLPFFPLFSVDVLWYKLHLQTTFHIPLKRRGTSIHLGIDMSSIWLSLVLSHSQERPHVELIAPSALDDTIM